MLKPEKETLAQVLAKHGHVIACPSCGTYVTMADVDPAAVAATYKRLKLAKLVKAYATSTEPWRSPSRA